MWILSLKLKWSENYNSDLILNHLNVCIIDIKMTGTFHYYTLKANFPLLKNQQLFWGYSIEQPHPKHILWISERWSTRSASLHNIHSICQKKTPSLQIGCFFKQKVMVFFLCLHKNVCCGFSLEAPLSEALLMSTHNICFHGETREILMLIPLLCGAIEIMKWYLTSIYVHKRGSMRLYMYYMYFLHRRLDTRC